MKTKSLGVLLTEEVLTCLSIELFGEQFLPVDVFSFWFHMQRSYDASGATFVHHK